MCPARSLRSQKASFEFAGRLNTPRVHAILPARISLSVISWLLRLSSVKEQIRRRTYLLEGQDTYGNSTATEFRFGPQSSRRNHFGERMSA